MVRKVLFVDDDEILNIVVQKSMAAYSEHFSMVMASDGFEALKMLETTSVSLVIIDLIMPRMDGMTLLSHIRGTYPDIPAILISSTSTEEISHLAKMEGIAATLEKPFSSEELSDHILTVLQKEAASGIMLNVSPTMFMQLMEMEGKTCTIRVVDRKSGDGGILYLSSGELLDARIGTLQGVDAACKLFSWDEVTVYFENRCKPRENRINSDLQPIIMKALAEKDESEDSSAHGDLEGVVTGPFAMSDDETGGAVPALHNQVGTNGEAGKGDTVTFEDLLRIMIRDESGESCGVGDVYYDADLDEVIELLSSLGQATGLGEFKVTHVDNGEVANRFLVADPDRRATLIEVSEESPINTIVDVLRYRN